MALNADKGDNVFQEPHSPVCPLCADRLRFHHHRAPAPTESDKESENTFDEKFSQQQISNETVEKAKYLSKIEQEIVIEINTARTAPPEYARRYLEPLRKYYHNRLLQLPGKTAIVTMEGLRAVDECIKDLQARKPLPPFLPGKGLRWQRVTI
jgi:hypothetical protein